MINLKPEFCSGCGFPLEGEDANPYRHQHVEIPPIKPIIIEHRLHQLECGKCGKTTRAKLLSNVDRISLWNESGSNGSGVERTVSP
ncbi:MAG: IS66 family transposase zinc-finger binding domain-containing protein [Rhizonema sp. NSF051]|nr:IS66 family transposase zinc-finger binding domain-containing protein [Rhizonema sp. NSF051]